MLKKIQQLLFYSIVLFFPTQLGKHFWPSWSYVSGLRVDYLSPTIYFTDILIGVLFFLVIPNLFRDLKRMLKRVQHDIFRHLSLGFGIFLFTILVGILQSKNPQAGFYGLLKLGEFSFFGWYVAQFIKEKKDLKTFMLIFSIGVCFESLLAIAQYIQQSSINGIFYFFGERAFTPLTPGIANASLDGKLVLRPYGTFSHPNVLAGYLVITMTLIFSFVIPNLFRDLGLNRMLKRVQHDRHALLHIASLLLGSVALFLSMSRVAIFLWIILGFYFLKPLMLNTKYLILFLMVVGSIFLAPLSPRLFNVSITEESFTRRIELMSTSIEMVKDHPFFGVGLNNFLVNLPYYQKNNTGSLFTSIQPVHNIFFLVASETGIIGLLGALVFLGKTLSYLRKKKEFSIFNFQFSILVIVLILGLFDHYFLTLQQGQLLLALVIGLCWSKTSV